MSVSPVTTPRAEQVTALPVAQPKDVSLVQAAAAEVLKPKADMVEKTMAKITAKVQFIEQEDPAAVSKFLGAVKGAVLAARNDEAADMAPIEQAFADLQDNCEPATVKTVIGYAKGMAAANILNKGATADEQRAYIKEQIEANDPLFTFLADPHGPAAVEEESEAPTPTVVAEDRKEAQVGTSEEPPVPVTETEEQPAAPGQKSGLSTTTKVVLAGTALLGLGLVAYKYAVPYFFPAADQQPEAPAADPVVQQAASTIVDTVTQTASQVGANFMDAVQTAFGRSPNPDFEYYPQGTFFQAVNGTTPNPEFVGSDTCPAVVQSIVDCAANTAAQVVTNTTQVFSFESPSTFSTLTPTAYPFDAVVAPAQPGIMDSIVQSAGNVTAWIAETATSLHAGAVEKAPVIGQAEAWVAQQAGNAVEFVQTQAPVVKDQVVELAGTVGDAVKGYASDAIAFAQTKLPGTVTVRDYTVDVAAGLDQAADAVASVQDEHAGAGVLGTATLAVLWGAKKLKNAVCGARAPAPAPAALPIHAGAAFNIGAFPNGRGNVAQIKSLLKGNGIPAAIVDARWNAVKAILVQNNLLPQGARNRDTLARANAQQAVQLIQAAIAAGQIA